MQALDDDLLMLLIEQQAVLIVSNDYGDEANKYLDEWAETLSAQQAMMLQAFDDRVNEMVNDIQHQRQREAH